MLPADRDNEHRRAARLEVLEHWLVPVSVGSDNGGILLDLTQQGLALQAVKYLPQDSTCTLEIYLPGFAADPVLAKGKVAWTSQSKVAGIEFVALPAPSRRRLDRWLEAVRRAAAGATASPLSHNAPEPEAGSLGSEALQPGGLQVSAPVAARRRASHLRLWNGMMLLISTFILLQLPLNHARIHQQAPPTTHESSQSAQSPAQPTTVPVVRPIPASQIDAAIGTSKAPPPRRAREVIHRRRVREVEEPEVIVRHYRNGHWE